MIRCLSDYASEYGRFSQIMFEYAEAYKNLETQFRERERNENRVLLARLSQAEQQRDTRLATLRTHCVEQENRLDGIYRAASMLEQTIPDKKYWKYKQKKQQTESAGDVPNLVAEGRYVDADVIALYRGLRESVEVLTSSLVPRFVVNTCHLVNKNYRKDMYAQIYTQMSKLRDMISALKRDYRTVLSTMEQETTAEFFSVAEEIASAKRQHDAALAVEQEEEKRVLKRQLLDNLGEVLNNGNVYGKAYSVLNDYFATYANNENSATISTFLLGVLNQKISLEDDGTVDHFLSTLFDSSIYNAGSLLIPVFMDVPFNKAMCLNYYAEYNDSVYSLFSNYALQMINLLAQDGVSVYLVDVTNMGAKYSAFSAVNEEEAAKHINIIRTAQELKELLDGMSDYIVETNSTYLRDSYSSVFEYNAQATIKREIKVLFFSNIGELESSENLAKLESIVRNGTCSGVISFVGVSSDELRVSGIVSQARVNAVSEIVSICDTVQMNSNGEMSLMPGSIRFFAFPDMERTVAQGIMEKCVRSGGGDRKIALQDHLISRAEYFTQTSYDGVVIPVGVDPLGNEYTVTLNGDAAYMLIGGNPNAGKSSLTHTIILQTLLRYGPDQVQFYLADLKNCVEFNRYVKKGIKSVKAVLNDATDADTMISFMEFIRHIVDERTRVFGEVEAATGQLVRKIEDFYEANNRHHITENLPRILVIIDEFQSLFECCNETGAITNYLLRMCRTYGIHLILASQRVQFDGSLRNSFTAQNKEYFVYRVIFKCPYNSAKQIMPEQCSDTNRENTALRRAQVLSSGQAVFNSNMGSTERHNTLVQCYYPNNDCIDTVCDAVVARQGKDKIPVLCSEAPAVFDLQDFMSSPDFVVGGSTRLHYDIYHSNTDPVRDDSYITIRYGDQIKILCSGVDDRVKLSSAFTFIVKLRHLYRNRLRINALIPPEQTSRFAPLTVHGELGVHVSTDVQDFLMYAETASDDAYLYNIICNPAEFADLHKEDWATSSTETVRSFEALISRENSFTLVIADDVKILKDRCSYLEKVLNIRIVSVGNVSSIRSAFPNDGVERVSECAYNVIRSEVIKAYYYSRSTGKFGRCKMYEADVLIDAALAAEEPFISAEGSVAPVEVPTGYSGLTGN